MTDMLWDGNYFYELYIVNKLVCSYGVKHKLKFKNVNNCAYKKQNDFF